MSGRIPSERSFGLSMGTAATALALLLAWRGYHRAAAVAAAAGIILLGAGLLAPAALRAPNRVWWRFAQALGWVNTRILLTLVFFVILTPVGFVMRMVGRNPLRPAGRNTNWSGYSAERRDPRHYEHLY